MLLINVRARSITIFWLNEGCVKDIQHLYHCFLSISLVAQVKCTLHIEQLEQFSSHIFVSINILNLDVLCLVKQTLQKYSDQYYTYIESANKAILWLELTWVWSAITVLLSGLYDTLSKPTNVPECLDADIEKAIVMHFSIHQAEASDPESLNLTLAQGLLLCL